MIALTPNQLALLCSILATYLTPNEIYDFLNTLDVAKLARIQDENGVSIVGAIGGLAVEPKFAKLFKAPAKPASGRVHWRWARNEQN